MHWGEKEKELVLLWLLPHMLYFLIWQVFYWQWTLNLKKGMPVMLLHFFALGLIYGLCPKLPRLGLGAGRNVFHATTSQAFLSFEFSVHCQLKSLSVSPDICLLFIWILPFLILLLFSELVWIDDVTPYIM